LYNTEFKLRVLLKVIEAYNHQGRAAEAIHLVNRLTDFLHDPQSQQVMQRLLTNQEDWQKLLAVLAVSFLDDLQLEGGLKLFDVPLESSFNPQYRIHYQGSKASLLIAMGRLEEARRLYEANIELCSTNVEAYGELTRTYCYYGNVLRLLKDFDAAEAAFEKGLEYAQKEACNNANSEPWIHWQYAKLKRDQGCPDAEVKAELEQADLWMQQNMLLSYPKSQVDIEAGKDALMFTHPECRLYQSAILRAKAQLHLHNGEEIPEDLLTDLRGLHPTWADLDYAEIWTRIPY
jgi:tetratricopeptide (TPR) repeat protein